jgi:hypothetical protein
MSKVKIQGDASGTGIFTIAAPNTNTDRTITLPDNAGTILTSDSSLTSANLSGRVPAANAPSGSIIQVLQYTTNGGGTFSSNDYVEMFSGQITPSATSSRILIMYQIGASSSSNQPFSSRLRRNTTVIGANIASGGSSRQGNMASAANANFSPQHQMQLITGHFLDSPNTISEITYRLDLSPRNDIGSITWRLGQIWSELTNGYSMPVVTTLTLMEIAI